MSPRVSSFTSEVIEIGNFEDLQTLVDLLNQTFGETFNYRLEEVRGENGVYLFVEDPIKEDEYECGIVQRKGKKAYAYSSGVHSMILGAYERYLDASSAKK